MKLKIRYFVYLILASLFLFPINGYSEFKVPQIRGPVNDYAQILPQTTVVSLNNLLRELKNIKKSEVAVLTVNNLSNETIEQASIKVTDQWTLGTKNDDNGILLMITMKEKRMRIEVGQGFEGNLTDSDAAEIIFRTMRPLMRAGDPASAVIAGLYKVVEQAYPELDTEEFFKKHLRFVNQRNRQKMNKTQIIIFIIINVSCLSLM